ncbi:protein transport protein sec22 [Penicillium herquei]|nr:protein transport protein sec22 [Penicillium herquei]
MVKSTQISRIDGLMLAASVDDEQARNGKELTAGFQAENELSEIKSQAKMIFRRLNRNAAPQASIESGQYNLHYLIKDDVCFLTICDRSYPRKLAFTYLADLASEFTTTYSPSQYQSPNLRPYAFVEFDTFIQRTKKLYQDSRASGNLDKLNDELRDVTKVMTKNIEDLLYRGDSLERMGELSGRLREDSKKYRKAAVRINWELLVKQYGPFVGVGLLIFILLFWRFF